MKMSSRKKRKRGFTDKMYLYNVVFVTAVVIISFIAVFLSGKLTIDTSALNVIIPSAYAELAVHTGFVIWKAKAENARKYKDVNIQSDEETGGIG
jgi:hypothetical protein